MGFPCFVIGILETWVANLVCLESTLGYLLL